MDVFQSSVVVDTPIWNFTPLCEPALYFARYLPDNNGLLLLYLLSELMFLSSVDVAVVFVIIGSKLMQLYFCILLSGGLDAELFFTSELIGILMYFQALVP